MTDTDEIVEVMARAIAPSRWAVMDGFLAELNRKYKGENFSYDPSQFKDKQSMNTAREVLSALTANGFNVVKDKEKPAIQLRTRT